MNNNFTPRAQQVLNIARREADRFHHNYIGAEHVLLGLLKLGQGVAISVMENAGVDIADLTLKIEQSIVPGAAASEGTLPYTPRVRKILIQAGEEAKKLRHTYVGTEHLLLAMLRDEDGLAWHSLMSAGLTYDSVRRGVMEEITPGSAWIPPPAMARRTMFPWMVRTATAAKRRRKKTAMPSCTARPPVIIPHPSTTAPTPLP